MRVASFRICLGIALILFPGCKSRPLGPYVSPRIRGLVLAAHTRKPLAGVTVARAQTEAGNSREIPRGGQMLIAPAPAVTGPDGKFELPGERVLSIFRGAGWSQVLLSFDRAGYMKLQTNFSTLSATNLSQEGPWLDIGMIELQPNH